MATPNRMSVYSNSSTPNAGRSTSQQSTQVSTTSLLNALHTAYASGQPYRLDASTSLVVNTWLTATQQHGESGLRGTVDNELARQAWEHARRRAEDSCIVLASLHQSTPSILNPFIATLPLTIPPSFHTALTVLRPFTHCVTPFNASTARHSALAATFSITLAGNINGASLSYAKSGIDLAQGLLHIPEEAGYRAFDVFYYLLTTASTPAEREFLDLKTPASYSLLNRSGTFDPPSYLPTADDTASAEDFRASLKALGIKGSAYRNLLATLAGLLKLGETVGLLVDQEDLEELCEDVGGLIGIDPDVLVRKCSTDEREALISGIYEALVDWVLMKANAAIQEDIQRIKDGDNSSDSASGGALGARTPRTDEDPEDTVNITVMEIPGQDLGRAAALRGVFDDNLGILAEMRDDGIDVPSPGPSVTREMQNAVADVAAELDLATTPASREKAAERERQENLLLRIGEEAEAGGFLRKIINPTEEEGLNIRHGAQARMDILGILGSSRTWYQLSLHPSDEPLASLGSLASVTSAWSAGTVSKQLRTWRLPEWANYRNKSLDFTADFDVDEFSTRYARLGCQDGRDGIESWVLERGWTNGEVVLGHDRVWLREGAWWLAESMLDLKANENSNMPQSTTMSTFGAGGFESSYSMAPPDLNSSGFFPPVEENYSSKDNLLQRQQSMAAASIMDRPKSVAMTAPVPPTMNTLPGDYGLGAKGDEKRGQVTYYDDEVGQFIGGLDPELAEPKAVTSQPISKSRRIWVGFVWALTFWIPSFALRYIGRMKRPDVRMAWREKFVLMSLIILLNAIVIFYIVEFGRLLCPNFDKAWNQKEVGYHQGDNDFWVSVHGKVYDITKFAKVTHGDIPPLADKTAMQPFAGQNLDDYFPMPLTIGCSYLVDNDIPVLMSNNTPQYPQAVHTSGPRYQPNNATKLHDINWYTNDFLPKITQYYKGDLVTSTGSISSQASNSNRQWVILNGKVYDLTNYYYTKKTQGNIAMYSFIPDKVSDIIQTGVGTDITPQWVSNDPDFEKTLNCMDNVFYEGKTDFRDTPRCQVNNYILLAFTIILCTIILTKFLSALQFGTKRRPAPQDKFVICQVPAYTEGEDQLRKGLDSLTALQYDNKRKLIFVICDGVITGGGNDRPTPKIVLDILGVDPKIDPPALPFKSVGQGSEQLNYGKVYSGLYEYEGNVVPYLVVVKVGKESEQSKTKPGNRGKRDSQLMIMNFLNRVHHRSPMSPLELEMFHQINNVIGVDPELYEYLFMVDADTSVKEDSLTRLVASCANDAKIAGICGETSLENEERSWWTMIQVYEYYISHHLAKAFESLFGSVTCLPGCFCMYRLRTADKGRPLIISDKVIDDYNITNVDTLHKKNLLSLGEDRYLTTIMTRHFPSMSYKFVPDAFANTAAPETWSVLLSQRRRWINSTIHNLAELVWLKDLCGFCCFSMRFVVFIDLFGTLILPATCAYLAYLIYRVATHSGQFPLISIVMIAAVYGLQAIIFIIKRQWQHIGWMIIYLLAYPIYSFVLPLYSFWNQDNFTWGSTRIVIGEKGNKQIVAIEDEGFDPRSIPLQRWDDYASANSLPGRRGMPANMEKYHDYDGGNMYEMDDMHSVYSNAKPASTILANFHQNQPYMTPSSPAAYRGHSARGSMASFAPFKDAPQYMPPQKRHSIANFSEAPYPEQPGSPYNTLGPRSSGMPSTENLLSMQSPPPMRPQSQLRSPLAGGGAMSQLGGMSRPVSTIDFRSGALSPGDTDNGAIQDAVRQCLTEVDLDTVTKKQVRALVEQRLQTQLSGEKRLYLDQEIDDQLANM